jgi:branched-chain amino acid transport system substrate-binding protein
MIYKTAQSLSLFLLAVSLLTACNQTPPTTNSASPAASDRTAIRIGAALAQTSNVALLGQESAAGVKLAETYFNQQKGINGTPFQLVFQDAGGDEVSAVNAFQTLITKNQVVGIIGPTLSQQAFSSDPVAERAKVPVLGPSNLAAKIPQIGNYIARVSAPASAVSPYAIQAALKLNPKAKRAAVLYAQDQDGAVSEAKIFQQAIQSRGLNLATTQKFQSSDTDFQTQATATINAKPDIVTISSLVADGGNLVRQLRELGYKGLILGGNGLNTPNIFPVCKAQCDGILIAQAYSPEMPGKMNETFQLLYRKQYKKDPSQLNAQGFTAVQVFVEALKAVDRKNKLKTLSLSQLRTDLNQQILTGRYDTPIGNIGFTPEGELIQKQFYVAQVKMNPDGKEGKFTFVK